MLASKSLRLRLLTYGVIAYLCLAFSWWSILLYTKNQDAFLAKVDNLRLVMVAEGSYESEDVFRQSEPFLQLKNKYDRQEWMIFGEAGLFLVSIILGVWIINNSYSHLIRSARHQHNFLLSITHELKSPIASAQLGLETLEKHELPREKREKIAGSSKNELTRLRNLVDNLLLAARMETSFQPFFEPHSISEILKNYFERIRAAHPDIQWDLHLPPTDFYAEIDKSGLIMILDNLVENAIKYSEGIPEITISAEQPEGKHFCLSVADRGIGIPEEERDSIFEKFYRIGSEETRKTKGTGLGLYIIKQLTNAHNGRIDIDSNQPRGTIFRLTFPTTQN